MNKRHSLIYICLASVSSKEYRSDVAMRLCCEAKEEDIPETFNEIEAFANVAMTYIEDRRKNPGAKVPTGLEYLMCPTPEEAAMRSVAVIDKFSANEKERNTLLAELLGGE